jgi:RHS repeat-associated protein
VGAGAAQKLHYIEPDALGTPRVVVDPTRGTQGTAVWTWDLAGEAFGATAPNQNPDGDANQFVFNMRFAGQRYDAVSGLNYNYFRDYDPGTGRYTQSDPIGLSGGMSTYGYVGGNPMTGIDPFGLRKLTRCEFNFLSKYYPTEVLSRAQIFEQNWSTRLNVGAIIWNLTPTKDVYAQTYRYDIYVTDDRPNAVDPSGLGRYGVGLLAHELAHSMQFVRQNKISGGVGMGSFDFYQQYLFDWLSNGDGYHGIPYEIDAFKMGKKVQDDLLQNGVGCGCY